MKDLFRAATLVIISVFIFTLFLPNTSVLAENLTVTLKAGSYELVAVENGQHRIRMADFGQLVAPGKPQLPARTFMVAVPPDAQIRDVRIEALEEITLPERLRISPAPAVSTVSFSPRMEAQSAAEWQANYLEIYEGYAAYPPTAGHYEGEGALRQYKFVRIAYFPFSYQPETQSVTYRPSLRVSIEYDRAPGSYTPTSTPADTRAQKTASKLLVNYGQAARWYTATPAPKAGSESYNYVVITTADLASSVEPLVQWKQAIGFQTNVITTDWIQATYAGFDLVEQVRNFLIDKYLDWGIEYVLLAGNIDVLPMRQCFPDSTNHGYDQWFCPPTDYYYADLTGDWDADGDGYYGEYVQDDVDFVPEVYVGRLPWSDAPTLTSICEKLVNFESDTGAWKHNALMLGTHANFENQDFTGLPVMDFAVLMEKMMADFMSGWTFTTMYEVEGLEPSIYPCNIPVTATNFVNEWAVGQYGVVNWGGHGSPYGAARLLWNWDDGDGVPEASVGELSTPYYIHTDYVQYLQDTHPSITFHVSCNNGWPELPNLGRELIRNGSAGSVVSTRVAWYAKGWDHEDDGLVASHDYYFMRNLVAYGETVGEALYNSKAYYAGHFVLDHYRHQHNLFDYVLYGEPALQREGVAFACVDSDNDGLGDPGQPASLCASDNCVDVPNADQADYDADGYGDACDLCPGYNVPGNALMVTGDVNCDSTINSSDVIYLVNCTFKGGPEPDPIPISGDVDCSGAMTSADIIRLVNFCFKSGVAPCDVCQM